MLFSCCLTCLERDIDDEAWLPSIANLSAYIADVTFFEPTPRVVELVGEPGGVPGGRPLAAVDQVDVDGRAGGS